MILARNSAIITYSKRKSIKQIKQDRKEKKMSWKRLKLWFTLHKGCKSCCLFCKHYTECAADIGAQTKE